MPSVAPRSHPLCSKPLVVYVTVSGVIGGVDTYILNNILLLRERNELWVIVGYRSAYEFYRRSGVERVIYVPLTRPHALPYVAKSIVELRQHRTVVIHSNDLVSCLWGKLIAQLVHRSCSHVTTIHSVITEHKIFRGVKRQVVFGLNRLLADFRQEAFISVSEEVRKSLAQVGIVNRNMPVIYNGIDLADRRHARRSSKSQGFAYRVGFVGRLSHEKGPDLFLACVRELPDSYEIHVYGEGELRGLFLSEPPQRVQIHGYVADKASIYANLDVVCITSRTEALPYVLLEGLAARCRVLALGLPILDEILDGSMLKSRIVCASIDEMRERIKIERSRDSSFDESEVAKVLSRFDNAKYAVQMTGLYRSLRRTRS